MEGAGKDREARLADPDIPVEELVEILPQAPAILRRFGVVCIQCGEPVWGTLREVAAARGIDDLAEILAALRRAATEE